MTKVIDWTHLVEHYRGKWVALADDETTVVAAGETPREAYEAGLKHVPSPILYQVPATDDYFVGV